MWRLLKPLTRSSGYEWARQLHFDFKTIKSVGMNFLEMKIHKIRENISDYVKGWKRVRIIQLRFCSEWSATPSYHSLKKSYLKFWYAIRCSFPRINHHLSHHPNPHKLSEDTLNWISIVQKWCVLFPLTCGYWLITKKKRILIIEF